MRIAIENSLPNHPVSAEAEWRKRAVIACERLGFEAIDVVTSDDIDRCRPDCVLVTHEFSPKTTEFPTIGLNWSPPSFFALDPIRRQAILSMDGHLWGSAAIAEWINNLMAANKKVSVLGPSLMLPSTHDCGPARPLPRDLAMFYAGVHWDGSRHGSIFKALSDLVPMHFYGPAAAWRKQGKAYRGSLPFDGVSVIDAIRSAGIALCLHKTEHRQANCPSMRLFEAAAAGALIITEDFAFPRQWFKDSVLYVDPELPAQTVAAQIVAHVFWANNNPADAGRLAERSNALFRERLTLESMLGVLPAFTETVKTARHFRPGSVLSTQTRPTVEYIIRVQSSDTSSVRRTLEGLAHQTYNPIGVLVVQSRPVEGISELIDMFEGQLAWIRCVSFEADGNRLSWQAAFRSLTADYIGILEDGVTLFPNHVASLMSYLRENSNCEAAYSGIVRIRDDPGHFVFAPRFKGPSRTVIEERRDLFCVEAEHPSSVPTSDVIGTNTWICRRSAFDTAGLQDSLIERSDGIDFGPMITEPTKLGCTAMVTAALHCRSIKTNTSPMRRPEPAPTVFLAQCVRLLQKSPLGIKRSRKSQNSA
jgi:phosphoglycerol transferase